MYWFHETRFDDFFVLEYHLEWKLPNVFLPRDCFWREKGWLRRTPKTQSSGMDILTMSGANDANDRSLAIEIICSFVRMQKGMPSQTQTFPKGWFVCVCVFFVQQQLPWPMTPSPIRKWLWGTAMGTKPCSVSLGSLKSTVQPLRYWAAKICRYSSPDMPSNKACMAGA